MRSYIKRGMIGVAIAAAAITVAGCGIERGDSDDKANVAELENRGFADPTLSTEGASSKHADYNVTAGVCRIQIEQVKNVWIYGMLVDVDSVKLEAHAADVGLEHCFSS